MEGAQRSWSGRGPVESFPGDVITVNAGEFHDGIPKDGCVRRWRMLFIQRRIVYALIGEEKGRRFEFAQPCVSSAKLRSVVTRVLQSAAERNDAMPVEQDLVRLLVDVERKSRRMGSYTKAVPSVARALALINDAPAARTTLSDLAQASGVSRFQLLRGFARGLGVTPHAYILQRRVREARRLIVEGETLAQAAIEAGFSDQSHMTRAFIRQYGYSPGRFAATIA
jgi:AraC-like DNA-binding protein